MNADTVTAAPWGDEEARKLSAMARHRLYGDQDHNAGRCRRDGRLSRENCAACCLLGYEPRGGHGDGWSVKTDGPHHVAWPSTYVEARRPIPRKWREAFELALDESEPLRRSVVTFGVRWAR